MPQEKGLRQGLDTDAGLKTGSCMFSAASNRGRQATVQGTSVHWLAGQSTRKIHSSAAVQLLINIATCCPVPRDLGYRYVQQQVYQISPFFAVTV